MSISSSDHKRMQDLQSLKGILRGMLLYQLSTTASHKGPRVWVIMHYTSVQKWPFEQVVIQATETYFTDHSCLH